jgi:hypothetical protein
MSTFEQSFKGAVNPLQENDAWTPLLNQMYPELCNALEGTPGWKPGKDGLPAMTLMVFAKDGKLKAMLSSRESLRGWSCSLEPTSDVLGAVETAMASGKGEWFTKKSKND